MLMTQEVMKSLPPGSHGGKHAVHKGFKFDETVVEFVGNGTGQLDFIGLETSAALALLS